MTTVPQQGWEAVRDAVAHAVSMHYDGCHKIYLAMDEGQILEYDGYLNHRPDFATIEQWYQDSSCGLEFVTATYTNEDGSTRFDSLIPQFFEEVQA